MTTAIKSTRNPSLTKAVPAQLGGRESTVDVANHGASGGYSGFTYYTDTVAFFDANRNAIMALVREMASDFGQDGLEMVAGFTCLKDDKLTPMDVSDALHTETENTQTVKNALAWFALEEVSRELNPEL